MKAFDLTMAVAVVALLGGCVTVGPEIAKMPALQRPEGATVALDVKVPGVRQRRRYEGELIEVHEDGLVVAWKSGASSEARLILVPWDVVSRIQATELPGFDFAFMSGGARRNAAIEKMHLVSRYPQRLPPELMANLLASYRQESIDPLTN
jgi:hypothetical protein